MKFTGPLVRNLVALAYAGVLVFALIAWTGLIDFGMFLVLAVACLSCVVALREFAKCPKCGKSFLVEASQDPPQTISVDAPPKQTRLWWPEETCSGCGRPT